jgi:threonyl-tRNA synthetase
MTLTGFSYGPKIDITLLDALRREWQCGTIQLDFQLPERFKLRYKDKDNDSQSAGTAGGSSDLPDGYSRPVMIHRAIFGSFERMIGVVTEHLAGKWPFWLSPRQVLVIPVMPAANDYALEVQGIFKAADMWVDVDLTGNTLQKKIRNGQIERYNFIFGECVQNRSRPTLTWRTVVGAQESETRTVNVRNRDDVSTQSRGELMPLQKVIDGLKALRDERRLLNGF